MTPLHFLLFGWIDLLRTPALKSVLKAKLRALRRVLPPAAEVEDGREPATQARAERDNLAGPLYDELLGQVGEEFLIREIDVWDKMIVVLDSGEHRPTLLRARKRK